MWLCKSIYQAFVIMVLAVLLFDEPVINMTSICFTALIMIQILNVLSEVSRLNKVVVYSCLGSLVLYFISIIFLPDYFDTGKMDSKFWTMTSVTVIVAWLPLWLLNYLAFKYYPTKDQKLMAQVGSTREIGLKAMLNKLMFWRKPDIDDIKKEFIEMKDIN